MSTDWYRLLQIDLLAWLGYGLLTLLALGVWLIGRTHRRREMPVPSRVRRVVLVGLVILGAFLLPPLAIIQWNLNVWIAVGGAAAFAIAVPLLRGRRTGAGSLDA
mgnify:CR=1 FL=1